MNEIKTLASAKEEIATATTPMPIRVDATLHLSARTVAWLADHSQARKLVGSVWDTLAELERAGHHPRPIAALRRVLAHHQPTPAGRCPTCRRWRWRRRRFPCTVWHQIRGELLGLFPDGGGTEVCHGRPPMALDSAASHPRPGPPGSPTHAQPPGARVVRHRREHARR